MLMGKLESDYSLKDKQNLENKRLKVSIKCQIPNLLLKMYLSPYRFGQFYEDDKKVRQEQQQQMLFNLPFQRVSWELLDCLILLELLCNHSIIMTETSQLPKISQKTKEKLQSYGFTNRLYDYLYLPSSYIPRSNGCIDSYTYLIMGLSVAGGLFVRSYTKKYGFPLLSFVVAFLAAPSVAFYAKKEADFFYTSEFSKKNSEIELQKYPILKESYEIVKKQAEDEIKALTERVRTLQQNLNRKQK